jgi:hypothetical protein
VRSGIVNFFCTLISPVVFPRPSLAVGSRIRKPRLVSSRIAASFPRQPARGGTLALEKKPALLYDVGRQPAKRHRGCLWWCKRR